MFAYNSTGPDAVTELCLGTDLSLRATKEMAKSIGRSMATERHLWLSLQSKRKIFLFLDGHPAVPFWPIQ